MSNKTHSLVSLMDLGRPLFTNQTDTFGIPEVYPDSNLTKETVFGKQALLYPPIEEERC